MAREDRRSGERVAELVVPLPEPRERERLVIRLVNKEKELLITDLASLIEAIGGDEAPTMLEGGPERRLFRDRLGTRVDSSRLTDGANRERQSVWS